jgi:hypothetical protein
MELKELEAHPKSPAFQLPALKKACTAASAQVPLPDPNLPLPERASYFANLSFNKIGTLLLIFSLLLLYTCGMQLKSHG